MTPLKISIALHYHCREGDYGVRCGDNNFSAPAVMEALEEFISLGLLRRRGAQFVAYGDVPILYEETDGLRVYVEALCRVPTPVMQWVIPEDDAA